MLVVPAGGRLHLLPRFGRRLAAARRRQQQFDWITTAFTAGPSRAKRRPFAGRPVADPAGIFSARRRPSACGWMVGPGFRAAATGPANANSSRRPVNLRRVFRQRRRAAAGPGRSRSATAELRRKLDELKAREGPAEFALSVTENGPGAARDVRAAARQPHAPGDKVEPAFPGGPGQRRPVGVAAGRRRRTTSRRRMALADWITSADNPLTAAGDGQPGLAASLRPRDRPLAEQFRQLGHAATHPELLDWLAAELVARGLAAQAAAPADHAVERLPDVARGRPPRRSRRIRRTTCSGGSTCAGWRRGDPRLDPGGRRAVELRRCTARASIREMSAEVMAGQSLPGDGLGQVVARGAGPAEHLHPRQAVADDADLLRASIFPRPIRAATPGSSTTPADAGAGACSTASSCTTRRPCFAERLRREAGDDPAARVGLALRLAFCRPASDAEIEPRRGR